MNLDSPEKSQRLKDSRQTEKEKSSLEIFSPSFTPFSNTEQNSKSGFLASSLMRVKHSEINAPPTPPCGYEKFACQVTNCHSGVAHCLAMSLCHFVKTGIGVF